MPFEYEHPRPAVTVDVAIFAADGDRLEVLLVERGSEPFRGRWALPGGFVGMDESLSDAARRELLEETGLEVDDLEQLHAFGKPGRDPRGRVISVVYVALVSRGEKSVRAGSDARVAKWFDADELPRLAFDHADILRLARDRMAERVGP